MEARKRERHFDTSSLHQKHFGKSQIFYANPNRLAINDIDKEFAKITRVIGEPSSHKRYGRTLHNQTRGMILQHP